MLSRNFTALQEYVQDMNPWLSSEAERMVAIFEEKVCENWEHTQHTIIPDRVVKEAQVILFFLFVRDRAARCNSIPSVCRCAQINPLTTSSLSLRALIYSGGRFSCSWPVPR